MNPEGIKLSSREDDDSQEDNTTVQVSWTERKRVRKRYLSTLDSASLVVNKMIGTGIFTTPGLTLHYTRSKKQALLLWILGAVYSLICLVIYLDYATAMPYNGAELIYLDRVYDFAKFELLPAVLFASYFISLYHTAGNALSFSRLVIIAAGRIDPNPANEKYNLSGALVKTIAVVSLAVVCFLLWVHPRTGMFLSKVVAAFKVMLLLTMGVWGVTARHRRPNGRSPTEDWGTQVATSPQDTKSSDDALSHFAAFIFVVYSYGGWESACYVTGEFDKREQKWIPKIRWGAILAVLTVGLAYGTIVLGYFMSCLYDDITSKEGDLGMASIFADQVIPDRGAIEVCIALSGIGNLVAVAYTSTKVKQAIALHHFLPFSTFLGSDKPFNTPGGSLLLHWIISSVLILAVPPNNYGYAFLIGLLTYGQMVVAGFVGLGRFKLDKVVEKSGLVWRPWIPSRAINYLGGFFLFLVNLVLCIVAILPTRLDKQGPKEAIPRHVWLVVVGSCVLGGFIYWYGLKSLQGTLGTSLGWKFKVVPIQTENDLEQLRHDTRRDGTRMRYVYEELKPGTPAYKIRQAWRWFLRMLAENL